MSKQSYLMLGHVELKCFNIQNNMSDGMSYKGAYNIVHELKWTVRLCYDLTDAECDGKYYATLQGADLKVKKNQLEY